MSASEFSLTVKSTLNEFKSIYRRCLPAKIKANIDIKELGISRQELLYASDKILYDKLTDIIDMIENNIFCSSNELSEHQGLEDFIDTLKQIQENYSIDRNQVVHKGQQSSKALLNVLQIMEMPDLMLNSMQEQKVQTYFKIIVKLNQRDHVNTLLKALKEKLPENPGFFKEQLFFLQRAKKYYSTKREPTQV